jgi:hypothetical protein
MWPFLYADRTVVPRVYFHGMVRTSTEGPTLHPIPRCFIGIYMPRMNPGRNTSQYNVKR